MLKKILRAFCNQKDYAVIKFKKIENLAPGVSRRLEDGSKMKIEAKGTFSGQTERLRASHKNNGRY